MEQEAAMDIKTSQRSTGRLGLIDIIIAWRDDANKRASDPRGFLTSEHWKGYHSACTDILIELRAYGYSVPNLPGLD